MLSSDKIRQILNSHRESLEKLATELASIRRENQNLKVSVEVLKHTLMQAQIDTRRPLPEQVTQKSLNVGDTQVLLLLYRLGAVSRKSPVSVISLKQAFNLVDSERTIMRRLGELETRAVVEHVGTRPKRFFLNENGLASLDSERKGALRTGLSASNFLSVNTR